MSGIILNDIDNNKYHTVIWSGGADSTLLLHEIAERFGTKRYPVRAISITHDLIDTNKQKAEKAKREMFLEKAKKDGLHIDHLPINISVNFGKDSTIQPVVYGLGQASIWASNCIHFLPHKSYVYFGYIKGDDFWKHEHAFKTLFNAQLDLMGKKAKIEYPLYLMRKTHVIQELEERGLLDYFVTCQLVRDDGTECGYCESCISLRNAKMEIDYIKKQDRARKKQKLKAVKTNE